MVRLIPPATRFPTRRSAGGHLSVRDEDAVLDDGGQCLDMTFELGSLSAGWFDDFGGLSEAVHGCEEHGGAGGRRRRTRRRSALTS